MSISNLPRILIIEDEALIILMLEDFLTEAGFRTAGVATTLESAFSLIETIDFDAALLDANLAGVSSAPAALALSSREIPFLVVSGYATSQHNAAFAGGVHISKPFEPKALVEAIWSILPDFKTVSA